MIVVDQAVVCRNFVDVNIRSVTESSGGFADFAP